MGLKQLKAKMANCFSYILRNSGLKNIRKKQRLVLDGHHFCEAGPLPSEQEAKILSKVLNRDSGFMTKDGMTLNGGDEATASEPGIQVDNLTDGAGLVNVDNFDFSEQEISPLFSAIAKFEPEYPDTTEGDLIMQEAAELVINPNVTCRDSILQHGLLLTADELSHPLRMWNSVSSITYFSGKNNKSIKSVWWNEFNSWQHMITNQHATISGTIPISPDCAYYYGLGKSFDPQDDQADIDFIPGLTYRFNQVKKSYNFSNSEEVCTAVRAALSGGDNHTALFFLWASRLLAAKHYGERVGNVNTSQIDVTNRNIDFPNYRLREFANAAAAGENIMLLPPNLRDEEIAAILLCTYSTEWSSRGSTSAWCIPAPADYPNLVKWASISPAQKSCVPVLLGGQEISYQLLKNALKKYLDYHNLHMQFSRAMHLVAVSLLHDGEIQLPPLRMTAECLFGLEKTTKELLIDHRQLGVEFVIIDIVKQSLASSFMDVYTAELEKRGVYSMDTIKNLAAHVLNKFKTMSLSKHAGGVIQYLYGVNLFEVDLLVSGTIPNSIRTILSDVSHSSNPIKVCALLATNYQPKSYLYSLVIKENQRQKLLVSSRLTDIDIMAVATLTSNEKDYQKEVPLLTYNFYRAKPDDGMQPKRFRVGEAMGARNIEDIQGDIVIRKTVLNTYPQGTTEQSVIPSLNALLKNSLTGGVLKFKPDPSINIPPSMGVGITSEIMRRGNKAIETGKKQNPGQYDLTFGGEMEDYSMEKSDFDYPESFKTLPLMGMIPLPKKDSPRVIVNVSPDYENYDVDTEKGTITKSTQTQNTKIAFFNDKTDALKPVQDDPPKGPEEWRACRKTVKLLVPEISPIIERTEKYGYNQTIPVGKAIHEAARESFPHPTPDTKPMYLQGMAGRPFAESDIDKDLLSRGVDTPQTHIFGVSDYSLERMIQYTLLKEVRSFGKRNTESFEEFYARRVEWMRDGAAFTKLETDYEKGAPKSKKTLMQQIPFSTIKAVLETDPIHEAKGHLKGKEVGKVRAIIGSTYEHYVIGSYISSKLEDGLVLRHSPGNKGARELLKEMLARVEACRRDHWVACLDYTDFNSQHTSHEQASVIRELAKFSPYSKDAEFMKIVEWYAKSFYNQWVEHGDLRVNAKKGLFSGVRATSLINTILNLTYHHEYVRRVLKERAGRRMYAHYNFGDDGWVEFNTEDAAIAYCRIAGESGSQINPGKQMIKKGAGEFLRVMYDETGARGCPVRAIENMVFGNTERRERPYREEKLEILYEQLSTIVRRGGDAKQAEALLLSEGQYLLGRDDQDVPASTVESFLYGDGRRLPLDPNKSLNITEADVAMKAQLSEERTQKPTDPEWNVIHTKAAEDYKNYLEKIDRVRIKPTAEKQFIKKFSEPAVNNPSKGMENLLPVRKYVTYDFTDSSSYLKRRVLSKVRKWQLLKPYITKFSYDEKMKDIMKDLDLTQAEIDQLVSDVQEVQIAGDWRLLSVRQCSDPTLSTELTSLWNGFNINSSGYSQNNYHSNHSNDALKRLSAVMLN
jgi:hypothetical protein